MNKKVVIFKANKKGKRKSNLHSEILDVLNKHPNESVVIFHNVTLTVKKGYHIALASNLILSGNSAIRWGKKDKFGGKPDG